jgi:multidrug resistance efflux pump
MAGRTNTEKIEATAHEVVRQGVLLANLDDRYRIEVGNLIADVRKQLERIQELTVKLSVLEQRLATAEKLLDEGRTRRWQVWLAILSATLALVVALVRK